MRSDSSLSVEQRAAAVDLFEAGYGSRATARKLGLPFRPVNSLYDRWVLHGKMVLVTRDTKAVYSWEFKRSIVARFLAGESARQLAAEFNFSSVDLVYSWVRVWRLAGDEGLRPKRRGRKPKTLIASPDPERSATVPDAALIEENTRLKAQLAYLKKLRDLRDQGQG
ncbi:helix-turn-helix domain-containing protein [Propionimicrobium sp. BV2F7]|uniref:helix-turn-helix domain-containing protein n=1 Tax=Propionimicrobium TaxID=203133 RepID=UPI0003D79966|nr:helix-turn-helix domain-containing protein [Propionimicrobium sp. BV2F7]ETJ97834.1 DNA-binding helix-turn-helix protein [Propionimicrobium sp. BV2F7]